MRVVVALNRAFDGPALIHLSPLKERHLNLHVAVRCTPILNRLRSKIMKSADLPATMDPVCVPRSRELAGANRVAHLMVGVTTTGGDLIFAGALTGDLPALDARTGNVLLRSALGGPVGGRVVTYNARGMQMRPVRHERTRRCGCCPS